MARPPPAPVEHALVKGGRTRWLSRGVAYAAVGAGGGAELAEFDRRSLWREAGYGTLFDYLHRELKLSLGAAHYRKVGAELVRRFPEIIEPIRDGRICITSLVALSKVITPENRHEVLSRFFHRSRQEAKAIAAAIRPVEDPPRRDVVTEIRSAPAVSTTEAQERATTSGNVHRECVSSAEMTFVNPGSSAGQRPLDAGATAGAAETTEGDAASMRARPADRPELEPLTAEFARLHVTVSKAFLQKLARSRDALSNTDPNASIAEVLEAGLDLVLARDLKRKAIVGRPQAKPRPTTTDRVPASIRRAVFLRDGFKCQFRLPNGEICGSTWRLQVDHIFPRALGGPSTLENCRVACGDHNVVAAREIFGDAWIDQFKRSAG